MKVYSTDVCVPISNLVECISWAEKEVKKHGLDCTNGLGMLVMEIFTQ